MTTRCQWYTRLVLPMVAVPVFHDEDTRNKWETKVWNAMGEFPEYKRTGKMVQRVLGEFGALANPSPVKLE